MSEDQKLQYRHCSRMRGHMRNYMGVGAVEDMPPPKTPPALAGRIVVFKKDGTEYDRRPYTAASVHPCQCGVVYSELDYLSDRKYRSYRHTNIWTGEVTECELIPEPMKMPSMASWFMESTSDGIVDWRNMYIHPLPPPRMRLYELAKELDVSNKTMLAIARELNVPAEHHMVRVSSEDADKIREYVAFAPKIV